MSNDEVAAAFSASFGQSLDDTWNAMIAAPRRRMCAFVWGCAEPAASNAVSLTNALAGYRVAAPIGASGAIIQATYTPTARAPGHP